MRKKGGARLLAANDLSAPTICQHFVMARARRAELNPDFDLIQNFCHNKSRC